MKDHKAIELIKALDESRKNQSVEIVYLRGLGFIDINKYLMCCLNEIKNR